MRSSEIDPSDSASLHPLHRPGERREKRRATIPRSPAGVARTAHRFFFFPGRRISPSGGVSPMLDLAVPSGTAEPAF
jgi:hypothetical protein